eukprot:UN04387
MLNIGGDKNDASYRYKMPPLQCQVEGRGNGIKTAFLNIADVAKHLHVVPIYIVKFFGFELGTQSGYDEPTQKGIVNGKHEVALLQSLLEKFIDQFVLCPKCKLPEINMTVSEKSSSIRINCAACGDKRVLKSTHRLVNFIVTHPPPKKSASGAHRNAQKEKEKEDKPETTTEAAAPVEKKEVEWHSDSSKDAQRERMRRDIGEPTEEEKAKFEKINALIAAAREIGAENSPSTLLKIYLLQAQRKPMDIFNEIRRLQISRGLDDVQRFKLILEVFVDPSVELRALPKQFVQPVIKFLFVKFINNDKNIALLLINVIEDFCGVIHPKLLAVFPLILKQLYEDDVLEDDYILSWHQSSAEASWVVSTDIARATRKRAEPLVAWLQEDDEDEDEEDA